MHGWICEFQTRSFDFKSVGATKAVAYENMRKGWLTHCQEFYGADETLLSQDNCRFFEFKDDVTCFRDSEPIPLPKKITVKIEWGQCVSDEDYVAETYHFDTMEEYNAFMDGVDAASGWMEYSVLEDSTDKEE